MISLWMSFCINPVGIGFLSVKMMQINNVSFKFDAQLARRKFQLAKRMQIKENLQ